MNKKISIVVVLLIVSSIFGQTQSQEFSLEEAIEYAIKNNAANKVAKKNIDAARARKWETTTMGLPQISGKVDYKNWLEQQVALLPAAAFDNTLSTIKIVENYFDGVQRRNIPVSAPQGFIPVRFGTKQSMDASLLLTQLIFDGSYLVGLQSAKTYLKISKQAQQKTILATREAVTNAYTNVLVTEALVETLKQNKTILDKTLSETKKVYENGFTEEESVEQLQITLGNLMSNLRNAQRMIIISRQMLNIALGNKVNNTLILKDSLDVLAKKYTNLELLGYDFDVNNHIDYNIAQNDREGKRLLMKLEKSKALPSLAAFINYGANANADKFQFFDSDQKWFSYSLFGVSLKVPIFSSLGRAAKIKRARIELENADIKLNEIQQKLLLQAQKTKSDYQLSIENMETAAKNLALAKRIEKKQRVKFSEGISTSFDLSRAQSQLYQQQNNYLQSMMQVISKKAALETALSLPFKK